MTGYGTIYGRIYRITPGNKVYIGGCERIEIPLFNQFMLPEHCNFCT